MELQGLERLLRAWYIVALLFLSWQTVSSGEPLYILSSSAKCPTGASHLQSLADCRAASQLLFLPDDTPEQESRSDWPLGCFKRDTGDLYFNPDGSQESTVIVGKVLCSWAAATTPAPTTLTTLTTDGTTVTSLSSQPTSTTVTTLSSQPTTVTTLTSQSTVSTSSSSSGDSATTTAFTPPPDDGLGYRGSCKTSLNLQDPDNYFMPERNTTPTIPSIPTTFDSRSQWPHCFAAVTIPAQGGCGSCWAFAPAAVARHRACIYDCEQNSRCDSSNVLYGRHLSVQQIMGCGSSRAGCDGGWAYQAYDAMKERLAWSADVPYQCQHGNIADQFNSNSGSCVRWPWNTANHPQACDVANEHVSVLGHYRLPLHSAGSNAAAVMAAELITNGPLAVDFCIRTNFFGFWSSDSTRIYTEADGCKHGDVVGGHMAMMIGFSERNGLQYWILQNSWSDAWAHDGFFYMERGVNLCGIENKASAPDVQVTKEPLTFATTTSTTIASSVSTSTSSAVDSSSTSSGTFEATVSSTSGSAVDSSSTTSGSLVSTASTTTGTSGSSATGGSSTTSDTLVSAASTTSGGTATSTSSLEVLWPEVLPGLRGTSTSTTTPQMLDIVSKSSSEESDGGGVPWLPFWIIMSVMLILTVSLAVIAAVLWQRHSVLRKSLRSQRPGLITGSRTSWSGSRLREHPDTMSPTNTAAGENPQMMGVCTGIPVAESIPDELPAVTGHVASSPRDATSKSFTDSSYSSSLRLLATHSNDVPRAMLRKVQDL